ncbi:MFS transporter [Amantichitinum ursilacus]|uniref:Inner membrane protein YbjJ n=1 Tax=Amantichitinum ursilacus TaxID=857265 RepID=A0A0N0XK25_9NEIS|nr:MFS transporter [Amantichitinum ursilacus]KPC54168.1 Inner membrane protein YbjJ [Amantichitinum ursilacus]
MFSADSPATRLATRIAFLVAGFGVSCWAPLVPFAKQRLAINDGQLGLLLLCIGIGSLCSMTFTGVISARYGSRRPIMLAGLAMAIILPFLALAPSSLTLGAALFCFGGALGSLDVAMNVHAVEVERAAQQPLMSGFHALFSVGGFSGSTAMTFLLSTQITPQTGTLLCAAVMVLAMLYAWPRLLKQSAPDSEGPLFALPHGIVLLLAVLCAVTFLAEGALLDWGALLVTGKGLVAAAQGGLAYMLFSIAMTAGRLSGDWVTARIGDRPTLFWGGVVAVAGFVAVLTVPVGLLALAGFVLIGLGASNVVPVLFRQAGRQKVMPPGLAVTALTTTGYAGVLLGPAAIGFVSKQVGLSNAFWMLVVLMALVPLTAGIVTRHSGQE